MKTEILDEPLQRFHEKINSFVYVPDEEFERLAVLMRPRKYKKGEVILREGDVCRHFYFIVKGYIRSFCIEDGNETNVNFYFENDIASDCRSLRLETPSERWLIAMENCNVYCAAKSEYSPVFEESAKLKEFLMRFFHDLYLKEEEDANHFRLFSPEERYKHILSSKPQFLQRIAQQHLASFLGISRKTLGRIRKG